MALLALTLYDHDLKKKPKYVTMVNEDGLGGLGKEEEGVSRHQSFSKKILDL